MRKVFTLLLLVSLPAVAQSSDDASPAASSQFDSTSAYSVEAIEGWQVYFNRRLLEDAPELADAARAELKRQLRAIVAVVPAAKVDALRKTKIWVEHYHPRFPCACYHPSADWLRDNGFNPDKVDSVDISNAENFVAWTRQQPWMVLHELAHAYHDQVLKHGHRSIRRAYERAKAGGAYEKVAHVDGGAVRHYALNNDEEYFAEATEAYFGKNDFAPFNQAELKDFDPVGYQLMEKIWGQPVGDSSSSIAK